MTALRNIAEGDAHPRSLRTSLWRRWSKLPLLGEEKSNDTAPLDGEASLAQAA